MNNTFTPRGSTGRLRRSKAPGEAELNALFQLLPQPALLVDFNEQVMLANSSFLRLTAYAMNEIAGHPLRELIKGLPEHFLSPEELYTVTLDRLNRPAVTLNLQVRAIDAEGQWLALVFEPQVDRFRKVTTSMEQVVRMIKEIRTTGDDDTPREVLDRALAAVHGLFEVSAIGVYRVGTDTGETAIWKVTGSGETSLLPDTLPANDLLRLSHTFIWKPGRRVQTELHRLARVQNLSMVASTPLSQNGLLVIADRVMEPSEQMTVIMEAIAGQINPVLDHIQQVIMLRQLALDKRRELAVWRSVGENAQEGILLLNPDLTVSEMNPAAEWMLGYADWEVKGQLVENILIGPERLAAALETAGQGIPTHNMGNASLHRRNGQSFPAHLQVVPVQREGETLAVIIFFSDVSEHVEIRNRTQQLEQRAVLGEVTAVFAHEVRNPINNISTGLQLLSVKMPETDPNQENIGRLLNDCQRLNHLMESVLNFSRQVEHKFEKVDMESLLRRLLDRWRPRMAKVNVTAFFQIEPGTPPVLGDPRSLEQVFTNLVSNAVDAIGAADQEGGSGGTLAVRVAPFTLPGGRPQVEVSVSDNGPGIPDGVRERIFEPFVTTKQNGTGLGLAITKRIVTAHHGSISVNSFPGGTVFHVLLSAYQGEAE